MSRKVIKGFTIIEILIVLGIVAIVSGLVMPGTLAQLNKSRIDSVAKQIVSNMFLYQQNAFSGKNNKSYGIYFDTNTYVLFRGNNYATADEFDQKDYGSTTHASQITINGGGSQILFPKGSFKPVNAGVIRITDDIINIDVSINAEGFISYTRL